MMELLSRFKTHLKRRLFFGLVVFAPFALTIYILVRLIAFGKSLLTKPGEGLLSVLMQKYSPGTLEQLRDSETGQLIWYVNYTSLILSILLVLLVLYMVGLLSATFFGRRFLSIGEKMLESIPGAQFVYNTIKQVLEIFSRPKSNAFKKVVVVEYPRQGVWALAFFTGVTKNSASGKTMLSVFLPSTPNPTTGFLMLLDPSDVLLTDLTVPEASRFLFSFGVVEIKNLTLRPFPEEEYTNRDEHLKIETPGASSLEAVKNQQRQKDSQRDGTITKADLADRG